MRKQRAEPYVSRGHLRRGYLITNVNFPPDTFEEIRQLAIKDKCSFAEKVNELVEWGLEEIKSAT